MECNHSNSTNVEIVVAMSSTGLLAVLVCALGAMLVWTLKLYRVFTYRLALYQVLSGMAGGAVCIMDAAFVNYYRDPDVYPLCLTVAFLLEYTMWVKLLFTLWTTFHLFVYSMCFRNLKKLELFYLFTSIAFPALISAIPFATGSYGLAGHWCWIVSLEQNCSGTLVIQGVVEQFVLWFFPSTVVLVIESAAVVTIGLALVCRVRRARRADGVDKSYVSARNQMLPLLAYPVIWCVLSIPTTVDRLYQSIYAESNSGLVMANAILTPGWNVAAGLALIVHILVLVRSRNPRRYLCCHGYRHVIPSINGRDAARSLHQGIQ